MKYDKCAAQLAEAILTLAQRPENLDNLQFYLSHHFPEWLSRYANTPETLVCELQQFAHMEL